MPKPTAAQEQNASILLATLQYLISHYTGQLVFDDRDYQKESYIKELEKTQADINADRHEQLKKRLDEHLQILIYEGNHNFNNFIKTETGYDIDIYEKFKTKVLPIIDNGIQTDQDFFYVTKYLNAYSDDPLEEQQVAILNAMLAKYVATYANDPEEEEIELLTVTVSHQLPDFGESEIVDEQVTIEVMTKEAYEVYQSRQPKPIVVYSPNGMNRVELESHGEGEFATTSVSISLAYGGGGIYNAKGENLPISAYWKDDYTVVIETKSEYEYYIKCKQVISHGEVYTIEYVEN